MGLYFSASVRSSKWCNLLRVNTNFNCRPKCSTTVPLLPNSGTDYVAVPCTADFFVLLFQDVATCYLTVAYFICIVFETPFKMILS